MSLTKQDLSDIRGVILDALDVAVNPRLDSVESSVDILSERVHGVETRLDGVETRLDGVETRLDGVEKQQRISNETLQQIEGKLIALESDVKEIYTMLSELQNSKTPDKTFAKLTLEDKVLDTHAKVLKLAKQLDISLPSN